jgi:nucleoside-diphosphate-sugar epimerase
MSFPMKVLVTGSSGLIGSEAVRYFDRRRARVYGIDHNMRADFFGSQGDTTWNRNFRDHARGSSIMHWTSATARRC